MSAPRKRPAACPPSSPAVFPYLGERVHFQRTSSSPIEVGRVVGRVFGLQIIEVETQARERVSLENAEIWTKEPPCEQ